MIAWFKLALMILKEIMIQYGFTYADLKLVLQRINTALEEALDRAISFKHPKPERRIVLYMKNAIIQSVECNDILYIESLGYHRIVHTRQGVFEETKQTLSTLLEELECLCPGQFCSPYRGYIINLNEISTITPSHIVMRDGFKVLMKRGDYRRIRDIYFAWTFSPFHE